LDFFRLLIAAAATEHDCTRDLTSVVLIYIEAVISVIAILLVEFLTHLLGMIGWLLARRGLTSIDIVPLLG